MRKISDVIIEADLTVDTDVLHVDSTNDLVGIGTTSPSYNLDVQGVTNGIIRAYGSSIGRLSLQNSTRHYSTSVQGSSWLFYDETGGGTRILINSSGNVGIGTTSLASGVKLHALGTTRPALFESDNLVSIVKIANSGTGNGSYNGLSLIANSTSSSNIDSYGMPLTFGTSATNGTNVTERMRITSGGNVLIGTTTDAGYKLDVAGELRADAYRIDLSATTQRALSSTGTDSLQIGDAGVNDIKFKNAAGNSVVIASSGRVGIGTTSPSGKLDVRGGRLYLSPSGNSGSGTSSHALIAWNANDTSFTSAALQAYNSHTSWDISDKWAFTVSPRANAGSVHTHASESALESVVINRFVQLNSTNTAALNTWTFFQWDGAGTSALDLKQPSKLWSISTYENGATAEKLSFSGAGDMEIKRRLGIGQTPAAPLDVKSNSVSSADSGIRLISNATSNVIAAIGERATDGGRFHLYDAGVEKLAFFSDGTANHISAGNLLIGTTTDSGYKLDVAGTARFSDNVTISSSGAPKDLTIYGNSAGEFMQYDGSASTLNIYGKSNSPALGVFVNGGAQPTDVQLKVGRDTGQYYGIKVDDNTASLIHRQDESSTNVHQVFNEIWSSASGDHNWRWNIKDAAGGSNSEKMQLTSGSVLTLGGGSNTITNTKVGQWDTAYSWGNHASAGYASASSLSNYLPLTGGTLTGSLAGTNITATNFYGQNLYVTSSGNTVANRIDNDGSGLYFTYGGASNKGIYLKDSNGYVGIGTTIPANKLTVVGTGAIAALRSTAAVGQNYLDFVNSSGTPKGYVGYGASSSDTLYLTQLVSGADIAFYNSGVRMTVKSSGNVGIGTTNPSRKLHVSSGNTDPAARFENTTSNGTVLELYSSGDSRTLYFQTDHIYASAGSLHFGNETGDIYLRTYSSGRVGIGTTSPQAKLHIVSSSSAHLVSKLEQDNSSYQAWYEANSQDGGYARFGIGDNADDYAFWNTNQSAYLWFSSSSERMRLTNAGNLGIGTTSPDAPLHVAGAVISDIGASYRKSYGSLDTTGNAVAGLNSSYNGASAMFTFVAFGHTGGYQKIVYSCYNAGGTWNAIRVIDEGTNDFDVEASSNAATITFTFKSTSGTKSYTPQVTVEHSGAALNTSYL